MKSGRHLSRGFTIVETMIYLAVTSLLLVSALGLVAGSQNKTEFSQAINDLNMQVNAVMNNVANGYYANTSDFASSKQCKNVAGYPDFVGTGQGQGTNDECIFIGRALQFTTGSNAYVYSMVGVRTITNGATGEQREVTSMKEASPLAIFPQSDYIVASISRSDFPEASETIKLKNGIQVKKVRYKKSGSPQSTAGVVFYSGLGSYSAITGGLNNGAQTVNFAPATPTIDVSTITSRANFLGILEKFSGSITPYTGTAGYDNPDNNDQQSGIWVCINSGGTHQYATLLIGGNGNRNSTDLQIHNGSCEDSGVDI